MATYKPMLPYLQAHYVLLDPDELAENSCIMLLARFESAIDR